LKTHFVNVRLDSDMDFVLLLIKDYQRYKEEHCVVITIIYTFDIEVTLCYMPVRSSKNEQ